MWPPGRNPRRAQAPPHWEESMISKSGVGRRTVLKGLVAGGIASVAGQGTAFAAAPRTIKIGLVMPQTGALAFFCEHIPFVLGQVKATLGGHFENGGAQHPYEIIVKDSQSSPNRAAEVTQDLLL